MIKCYLFDSLEFLQKVQQLYWIKLHTLEFAAHIYTYSLNQSITSSEQRHIIFCSTFLVCYTYKTENIYFNISDSVHWKKICLRKGIIQDIPCAVKIDRHDNNTAERMEVRILNVMILRGKSEKGNQRYSMITYSCPVVLNVDLSILSVKSRIYGSGACLNFFLFG